MNGTAEGAGTNAQDWVYSNLYAHRVHTGRDADLPPDYGTASAGATAAKVAGLVAVGIGGALLKGGLSLARRGLFR